MQLPGFVPVLFPAVSATVRRWHTFFDCFLAVPLCVIPFRMQSSLPVQRYAVVLLFLSSPAWVSARSNPGIAALPVCPATRGAYYLKDGSWDVLKPVSIKSVRTSGIRRMLLTYSSKAVAVYEHPHAPVTLGSQPRFCLSGFGSSIKGLTIVKLDLKDDRREMPFVTKRLFRRPNVQYDSDDIQPVRLISSDNAQVVLATERPLESGQYILFPPSSVDSTGNPHGYDFGVN
jgi:hypothetical protein